MRQACFRHMLLIRANLWTFEIEYLSNRSPLHFIITIMKKLILSIALAVAAPFAWAQVSETTTTTTTEGSGTITVFTPGSSIMLNETSGPRHYRFGKHVVYVTRGGRELDEATVKTKVRVGVPVHVHYVTEGNEMAVDRVILDED